MARKLVGATLAAMACFFLWSCSKKSSTSSGAGTGSNSSNPTGTQTSTLSSGSSSGLNFHTGTLLTCAQGTSSCDLYYNMSSARFCMASTSAGIADAGPVSGLSAVTTIPASGYNNCVTAAAGHGYVGVLADGTHVRFYDTQGGTIDWQYPFSASSGGGSSGSGGGGSVTSSSPTLTLSASAVNGLSAGGTITSNTGGISCTASGGACSASFAPGTSITLTNAPSSGSNLVWLGGFCSGLSNTCTFTLNASTTVAAGFCTTTGQVSTLPSQAFIACSNTVNVQLWGGGGGGDTGYGVCQSPPGGGACSTSYYGGTGGGGGGYASQNGLSVTPGTSYPVTVGSGGRPAAKFCGDTSGQYTITSSGGGTSTFLTLTATGGGAGAYPYYGSAGSPGGNAGGSGSSTISNGYYNGGPGGNAGGTNGGTGGAAGTSTTGGNAFNGNSPGGGGGGGAYPTTSCPDGTHSSGVGGTGASGKIVISW